MTGQEAQPRQQLRVVIAGGDPATRNWLLTTLRGAGHLAEHHATGHDALDWLAQHPADLLVACIGDEDTPAPALVEQAQRLQSGLAVLYVADPHRDAMPWADVPPGGVLLYGPAGPDLLPAIAVSLTRARTQPSV